MALFYLYLAGGQRLPWECGIPEQGPPWLKRSDFEARRFDFLRWTRQSSSHPPYDAGDLRRGYRRLVPCRLFWLWTGRRAGLLVKPPPVPLSALELLSSTITSGAPGFAKPHQCRYISEILLVVARSATLAVSRLFRDLVTTSATTVSRDVTSCCASLRDRFILLLPCHLGALLWPLQLRQQAVYANHSPSVLRHIALSLTVGWFSLLPRPAATYQRYSQTCGRKPPRNRGSSPDFFRYSILGLALAGGSFRGGAAVARDGLSL